MAERTVTIRAVLEDVFSAPLGAFSKGLVGLGDTVKRIDTALSPFTNKVTAFVAGLVSLRTAQSALSSAKTEVDAQQRLLSALENRVQLQKQIIKTASEIQSKSLQGDEILVDQAATMKAVGINAALIPRALQVAADVAERLKQPIETVSRDIALIASGGEARTLPRFIGELKDLKAAGASAEEVLGFLEARFKGAAEAATKTTFGKITQEQNLLSDALEKIGKTLADIWLPILQAGRVQVEKIAAALSGDEIAIFTKFINANSESLIRWGTVVAASIASLLALKAVIVVLSLAFSAITAVVLSAKLAFLAFGVVVTGIVAPLSAVASALIAFPGLLILVGAAAAALALNFDRVVKAGKGISGSVAGTARSFDEAFKASDGIKDALGSIAKFAGDFLSDAREIAAEVGRGELAVSDLWDFVRTRLGGFAALLGDKVGAPFSAAIKLAGQLAGDLWDLFASKAQAAGLKAALSIQESVGPVIQVIAKGLDSVFGGTRSVDLKLDTASLKFGLAFTEAAVEETSRRIEAAPERFRALLAAEAKDSAKTIEKAAKDELELQDRLRASREKAAEESIRLISKQTEEEKGRILSLADTVASAQDELNRTKVDLGEVLLGGLDESKIKEVFRSVAEDSRDLVSEAIASDLERGFREGEISARRFFELRKTLAEQASNAELRSADQIVESRRKTLESAKAEADEAGRMRNFLAEQLSIAEQQQAPARIRLDTAKQLLDFTKLQSESLITISEDTRSLSDAEEKRNEVVARRIRIEQELADVRTSVAEQLVQQAEDARSRLEEERDKIRTLFERGILSGAEVNAQDAELLSGLQAKLRELQAAFDDLAPSGEAAGQGIERAREALGRLKETADSDVPQVVTRLQEVQEEERRLAEEGERTGSSWGDFTQGVKLGAKETVLQFSNLASAGVQAGRQLTDSLVEGVVDVFVRGRKSLKQFLGEFLLAIAAMLTKLLIYNAIARSLGFSGPLADPNLAGGGGGTQAWTGGLIGYSGDLQKFAGGGEAQRRRQGLGIVPGPKVRRDIVKALLMPGEYVQPVDSVLHYGRRVMAGIRRRVIPKEIFEPWLSGSSDILQAGASSARKFASGGEVGFGGDSFSSSSSSQSQGSVIPAVVIPSEEVARRILAGGRGALLQFLQEEGYRRGGEGV